MKLKHWIKIIVFVVLAAGILLFASELLCVANEKDTVGVYGFFKEPEDSIDVAFVGASGLYTYFYAPLGYEEQGFTSYALATSTMTAPIYRYATEMVLDRQNPQLLVFDTECFTYEEEYQYDEASLRKFLDACPNSEIKTRAINALVSDDLKSSFEYTFQKYHSGWTRIGECFQVLKDKMDMNSRGYAVTKNFGTTPAIQEYRNPEKPFNVTESGLKYLQELLDYLHEAGVEHALFVRLPEMYRYVPNELYGTMIEMIRGAGYDFVNLEGAVQDIGLTMETDYYNPSHLNMLGTEKFTKFFAGYLMYMYDLDTTHSEAVDKEWQECASHNDEIIPYLKELTLRNANGFLYTQRDFLEQVDIDETFPVPEVDEADEAMLTAAAGAEAVAAAGAEAHVDAVENAADGANVTAAANAGAPENAAVGADGSPAAAVEGPAKGK